MWDLFQKHRSSERECHQRSGEDAETEATASMSYLTTLYVRWRYLVLLGTLLLVLVVQPISFGSSTPPQLVDALLMLVTVALLLSFCPDKNRRLAALAFGIPTGLLSLGGHLLTCQPSNTV